MGPGVDEPEEDTVEGDPGNVADEDLRAPGRPDGVGQSEQDRRHEDGSGRPDEEAQSLLDRDPEDELHDQGEHERDGEQPTERNKSHPGPREREICNEIEGPQSAPAIRSVRRWPRPGTWAEHGLLPVADLGLRSGG